MGQIIELSDELVRSAEETSKLFGHSVGEQIEQWVKFGQAFDRLLAGNQITELIVRMQKPDAD